ncbi:MAG: lantibiotic dehydratase [Myxococcota bacterium]
MREAPPLVALEHGWSLWPTFELRGAGFPVALLDPLHHAPLIEAVTTVEAARSRASELRAVAMRALQTARQSSGDRKAWNAFTDEVRRGTRNVTTGSPEVDPALRALDHARDELANAEAAVESAWAACLETTDAKLRECALSSDFRRAVLLQNRGALSGGIDAWLRTTPGTEDHTARRARLAVTSYLQRYTTKNDTVGFFGPVGWGHFVDDANALTQRAGPALVDRTAVHLEPWAVAAVADAVLPSVMDRLVPTLSPRVRLEGTELHGVPTRSLRGTRTLTPAMRELLERVDGRRTYAEIAGDDEKRARVQELVQQGVVRLRLDVQVTTSPQDALCRQLDALGAVEARNTVRSFTGALDAVQAHVHDDKSLGPALQTLDERFASITGREATRHAGQTYGSRTLIYVNCRRDHELHLGKPVLAALRSPMSLLLVAARWFTYEVSRGFLRELHKIHASLSRVMGPRVPLLHVYHRLIPLFAHPPATFIADARRRTEARWTEVLALPDGEAHVVELDASTLGPRVRDAFAAPHPGMPSARHHCPDVLFCRREDGSLMPVLGEIHAGVNTLAVLQAVDMSRDADELRALYRRDLPPPVVSELQHEDYALCAHDSLLDAGDLHVDTGSRYISWLPPERTVLLSDLDLVVEDGFLRVQSNRDGSVFDALHLLERMVRLNATTEFHLPVRAPHQPRVVVNGVVLIRETWTLQRDAFESLVDATGPARMRAAHALRHTHGMPRHLFARTPGEHKPLYVDVESPASLEVLVRALREAPWVKLSEMLPAPEHAWLLDARGQRYVSECRMVAVDPVPARPISVEEALA